MTIKDIKISYREIEWISDKLAYWSSHDISQLDESYNYTQHWINVYEGLNKLENLQRALKARIELNKNIIETEHLDKITFAKLEAEVSLCNLLLMLLEEI